MYTPRSAERAPRGVRRLQRRPPRGVHALPVAVLKRCRRIEGRAHAGHAHYVPARDVLVEGRRRVEHLRAALAA